MTDADYEARIAVLEEIADMLREDLVRAQATLRDQFAGQALAGMLANPTYAWVGYEAHLTTAAFRIADAMLEARKEKGNG
jgi:hypothetical protein